MCLMSVCLAVSLASQRALTCSFIRQLPLALLVHHPPFLLHLLLYHFLADHVSLYLPSCLCGCPPPSVSFSAFVCLMGKGGVCLSSPLPWSLILPSERKTRKGGVSARELKRIETKWPKFPIQKAVLVLLARERTRMFRCKN